MAEAKSTEQICKNTIFISKSKGSSVKEFADATIAQRAWLSDILSYVPEEARQIAIDPPNILLYWASHIWCELSPRMVNGKKKITYNKYLNFRFLKKYRKKYRYKIFKYKIVGFQMHWKNVHFFKHASNVIFESPTMFCIFSNYKLNFIIKKGTKKIVDNEFNSCCLENITLNEGLEEIGIQAFKNSNIKNIYIPESVKLVGDRAFYGCKKAINIEYSDTVKFGEDVFKKCCPVVVNGNFV